MWIRFNTSSQKNNIFFWFLMHFQMLCLSKSHKNRRPTPIFCSFYYIFNYLLKKKGFLCVIEWPVETFAKSIFYFAI